MDQFKVWEDAFDEVLSNEINYINGNIHFVTPKDWQYIIETKSIELYNRKDLVVSILTTSKLTKEQYIELLIIFSNIEQEITDNPQEPKMEMIEMIDRDVCRTFRSNPFFKDLKNQSRLKQLLMSYADFDPEVGYAQGMNFIGATLIYYDVPNIFLLFKAIISRHRNNYITGTPGLFQNIAKLQFKIKQKLPKLHNHFKNIGLKDLSISFSPHFLTLFVQNAPLKYHLILLSLYMLQGEKILIKLMMGMLKTFQHVMLDIEDVQAMTKYIKTELVQEFFKQLQLSRTHWYLVKLLLDINFIKKKTNN